MDDDATLGMPARAGLTTQAERVLLERRAREAAALRENLRRRRGQAHARQASAKADEESPCR